MYREVTYIDEADVYVCNNCGAYAPRGMEIEHYPSCMPGESRRWEEVYARGSDTSNEG